MNHLSQKQKVTVMIALMGAMFFAAINQTIVSSAMPRIIALLGGMEYYSWVVTIFMLASTISTVLVGKLSDIYGRKLFLITGIIVFMIGSFLTGLSTDIFQMIIYRAIQGVGAGILMSTTVTAVGDLFAPRERAKWTGVMMAIFGFSSILGPTVGGVMIDHMPWKWLFWIFLPLGIIVLAMIWSMFPKATRVEAESVDYWGSLVLSVSIVALLLGFSWAGGKYAWGSVEILGLFALTLIGIVVLILIERKAKSPVMPLSLFKNSIVNISNSVGFLMNAGMMGAMIYLPFFVQGVEGLTPTQSGFVNMPMSVMMIILSTLTGRWISKSGKYKRFAIIGVAVMVVSMIMMAYMNTVAFAVASMTIFGVGLGLSMPVFTLTVQNAVPASQLGVATATATLFRNLGGTIGIAILGSVMNSTMTNKLHNAMNSGAGVDLSKVSPEIAAQLTALMSPQLLLDQPLLKQLQLTLPAQVQPLFAQMVAMLRAVLSETLSMVFIIGAVLVTIGLVFTFFLKEIPLRTSNDKPPRKAEEEESIIKAKKPKKATAH
ncbi:DHA2 family efflux MFS transporter permease subunit [Paenibacillus sp. LMG 31456]|uniref:DHA2 family efflux MFS transporter permease subunit n=1 Tax=Paenibacillus foliorum TaxID=2654974 RepID=A0A972GRB9_9BACL|nr:MDR family MFS transporter [Paenibacillus foliorum]NOU92402.1 DHA2 family efflux MFS transporter permease subunit [Paenibacillus foliorum]